MVHKREYLCKLEILNSPHRGKIVWSRHGTQRQAADADGPPRLERAEAGSFVQRERFGDLADPPGEVAAGLDNAFRLARSVGVTLDYLADDSLDVEPPRPEDHLSAEERKVLSLAQKIGCSQVITILENIRFLGYEVAMSRLVGGKPIIEVDKEVGDNRPVMTPPAMAASASLASGQFRDGLNRSGLTRSRGRRSAAFKTVCAGDSMGS